MHFPPYPVTLAAQSPGPQWMEEWRETRRELAKGLARNWALGLKSKPHFKEIWSISSTPTWQPRQRGRLAGCYFMLGSLELCKAERADSLACGFTFARWDEDTQKMGLESQEVLVHILTEGADEIADSRAQPRRSKDSVLTD